MPRRADENQPSIVVALRAAGATVQHLHEVGGGCPDLVVGRLGKTYLLEIKSSRGKLTPHEAAWHDEWRGQADGVPQFTISGQIDQRKLEREKARFRKQHEGGSGGR